MPMFRSWSLALCASLVALPAAAAAPAPAPKSSTPVTTEEQVVMPADGPYAVSLENLRGRVIVRGWNKNVVLVRSRKWATHPLAGSEADLFAVAKVAIAHAEPDTVTIKTELPGQTGFPSVLASKLLHMAVDYEVVVPPDCAVSVRQEWGAVVAIGVRGRVMLATKDGDVAVTGVRGWAQARTERGKLSFTDVDGDAIGETFHGDLSFKGVTGDIKATSSDGEVRADVSPRFVGEVSYHTVAGEFRSDLATFGTDLQPGDRGYVGVLRGPLAGHDDPIVRYAFDTASGSATVASERAGPR